MTSRAGHVGLAKLAKPAKPGLGWATHALPLNYRPDLMFPVHTETQHNALACFLGLLMIPRLPGTGRACPTTSASLLDLTRPPRSLKRGSSL